MCYKFAAYAALVLTQTSFLKVSLVSSQGRQSWLRRSLQVVKETYQLKTRTCHNVSRICAYRMGYIACTKNPTMCYKFAAYAALVLTQTSFLKVSLVSSQGRQSWLRRSLQVVKETYQLKTRTCHNVSRICAYTMG